MSLASAEFCLVCWSERLKTYLRLAIDALKKARRAAGSRIIIWSAGAGKTTMATVAARNGYESVWITSGPAIEKAGDGVGCPGLICRTVIFCLSMRFIG